MHGIKGLLIVQKSLTTKFLSLELGKSGCSAAGTEEVVTSGTGKL